MGWRYYKGVPPRQRYAYGPECLCVFQVRLAQARGEIEQVTAAKPGTGRDLLHAAEFCG